MRPKRHYIGVDAEMTGFRTRHNLALVYRRLNLADKAEEQLLAIIDEAPHFGPAWLALVELYLDQKRESAAEVLPRRLEGRAYRDTILPALQARLALGRGNLAGARQILEDGIGQCPKAIWLRLFLADLLMRVVKDEAAAQDQFRAILSLAPNEPQARLKLAQLLAARGE
jgi:predicted Zn-dependent protease